HIVNYWSTRTGCELCTLSHDDDGEVSSALMAMADRLSHFFDIKWPLGNQDDIGSAGNPAVERDPTRVASHHFHDHHAVMRLGSRVHSVNGLANDVARRIEPEGVIRPAQVVVNGFGHAHNFSSLFM